MSRRPAPLPAELGPVFTFSEARDLGVSKDRLRHSDLDSPFRGLYRRASDGTPLQSAGPHPEPEWLLRRIRDARALHRLLAEDAFFCGITAAHLWGLPVPRGEDDRVRVARFAPRRVAARSGVRGVSVSPGMADLREHYGMRLTSPASTWAMLGAELSLPDLVVLGDAIVRRPRIPGTDRLERQPLGTIDSLRRELSRRGRRGLVRLRDALPLIRTGSASPPETRLRLLLEGAGLPAVSLDVDVRDRRGRLLGCSELAYPGFKVAIEYESEHHRVSREQWNRDIRKYQDYADAGWQTIRVTATMLFGDEREVVRRVGDALVRSGGRL